MPRNPLADPDAPPRGKSADAYHHGDLRAALIAAAREVLETTPPEAVSLKALALRLGVSQPAPYRHFDNREALLAAVAADGFERFRSDLVAAAEAGRPEEAFERACVAYIRFGQSNKGVYRLMFASGVERVVANPDLARASASAFDFLLDSVAARAPKEKARALAIWIWSSLHGMVMLTAEGLMAGPSGEPVTPAEVVHEMIATLEGRPR